MKRILTFAVPAALLALAGCGGDTCTSAAAPLPDLPAGRTCTLTPGQVATFTIQLCGKCTDTAAACQAEFTGGQIELAPVVQQCAAQQGCSISAECAIQPPTATCSLEIPSSVTTGTPITIVANDQQGSPTVVTHSVVVGTGTSCTL